MPLSKEEMREYQRKRREQARGKVAEYETFTATDGDLAIRRKKPFHEHYWLRTDGGDMATCIQFTMQGRVIGGCGESRPYKGKLLPAFDGETPFTAGYLRDRILDRVNSKK